MPATSSFLPCFYAAAGFYAGSLLFSIMKQERPSRALLALGFAAHTASLVLRGFHFGPFTPLNMLSETFSLPWLLALAALLPRRECGGKSTSGLILIVCALAAVPLIVQTPAVTPSPRTSTVFAPLFFLTEVGAHALFILGGWHAFLFLSGRNGAQTFNTYTIWGFILFSIAQVVGAVWSWIGWTVPFHWSERHLISAAVWCFYCAWLHLRFSPRWSPRGQAAFALCGSLLTFLFTYVYYLGAGNA